MCPTRYTMGSVAMCAEVRAGQFSKGGRSRPGDVVELLRRSAAPLEPENGPKPQEWRSSCAPLGLTVFVPERFNAVAKLLASRFVATVRTPNEGTECV